MSVYLFFTILILIVSNIILFFGLLETKRQFEGESSLLRARIDSLDKRVKTSHRLTETLANRRSVPEKLTGSMDLVHKGKKARVSAVFYPHP